MIAERFPGATICVRMGQFTEAAHQVATKPSEMTRKRYQKNAYSAGGGTMNSSAAMGMPADTEICAANVRPCFGHLRAKKSPTLPPIRLPTALAMKLEAVRAPASTS